MFMFMFLVFFIQLSILIPPCVFLLISNLDTLWEIIVEIDLEGLLDVSMASVIRANGGVVVCEQVAPLMLGSPELPPIALQSKDKDKDNAPSLYTDNFQVQVRNFSQHHKLHHNLNLLVCFYQFLVHNFQLVLVVSI